ncbi:MAG TPA: hypothetical protein ENH28_07525 [Euryarchaeota archaeon]|nr:hypothetical protein [Euryarchaeota archaeon]
MNIVSREELEKELEKIDKGISEIACHEKENLSRFLGRTSGETYYEKVFYTTWIRYRSEKYVTFEDFDIKNMVEVKISEECGQILSFFS